MSGYPDLDTKQCEAAADALFAAFTWNGSREGEPFWSYVHDVLQELGSHGNYTGSLQPVPMGLRACMNDAGLAAENISANLEED